MTGAMAFLVATAAAAPRVLILGGTGRIGSAVASHLLTCPIDILLAGRSVDRGEAAVREVLGERSADAVASVSFLKLDFRDEDALRTAMRGAAAVVHTAGPYAGEQPTVLKVALAESVPAYVDLSDPLEYLDAAKKIGQEALNSNACETLALCAGGAFPGLSNVLAMECVARLGDRGVKDVDFSYFTAGLGGSGEINLFITNDGFGCEVPVYRNGEFAPSLDAGSRERATGKSRVEFFLAESDPSARLVGERAVWSWPFPEGALIPRQVTGGISGSSSVGMGTAPDIWNEVMGIMVDVVPRAWWRSAAFSNGLAKFSKPLVDFTDRFVGETHAMRIDVTSEDGSRVSAVQAHESFRRCVGMSCAEFTRALLETKGLLPPNAKDTAGATMHGSLPSAGTFTPEELFATQEVRGLMLDRLLAMPGTLNAGFEEVLHDQDK